MFLVHRAHQVLVAPARPALFPSRGWVTLVPYLVVLVSEPRVDFGVPSLAGRRRGLAKSVNRIGSRPHRHEIAAESVDPTNGEGLWHARLFFVEVYAPDLAVGEGCVHLVAGARDSLGSLDLPLVVRHVPCSVVAGVDVLPFLLGRNVHALVLERLAVQNHRALLVLALTVQPFPAQRDAREPRPVCLCESFHLVGFCPRASHRHAFRWCFSAEGKLHNLRGARARHHESKAVVQLASGILRLERPANVSEDTTRPLGANRLAPGDVREYLGEDLEG